MVRSMENVLPEEKEVAGVKGTSPEQQKPRVAQLEKSAVKAHERGKKIQSSLSFRPYEALRKRNQKEN